MQRRLDYEYGLKRLKAALSDEQALLNFARLEFRLLENLQTERDYGANQANLTDRNMILDALIRLTDEQLGVSFLDLCLVPPPPGTKKPGSSVQKSSGPISMFISYTHKDEDLLTQLEAHLASLRREGLIENWHDRKIDPGSEWQGEIDEYLASAEIILLLISAHFLNSDYCYDVEVKRAMERHESGKAVVIPIILRPVDWKGAPFARLQALPKDAKPVTQWADRDEAFLDAVKGIRKVIKSRR
jgi:hypothetical protein